MKTMILAAAALVIGLGGGSYVSGTKVKDVLLAAHADSVAAAEAADHATEVATHEPADAAVDGADGGVTLDMGIGQHEPGVDSAATAATEDPAHAVPATADGDPMILPAGTTVDAASMPPAGAVTPPAETTAPPEAPGSGVPGAAIGVDVATPEALAEAAKKLSKIFGAMKAPDAAAVLQEMSDVEVKAILLQMSDRLAAAVLGEFEPGRAAELTRVVLLAREGGE